MASERKIQEFLGLLESMGLLTARKGAPPALESPVPSVRERAEGNVLLLFHRAFSDVSDEDFDEVIEGFLRSPKSQWYPQPGPLRELLPSRLQRDLVAESADSAWGELWEGFGRHGCGPGTPRNAFLFELDPTDARTRSLYGPRWDWSGEPGEVEAKRHTLKRMGGIDALLAKRTVHNEGALLTSWRAIFRQYVQANDIRDELAIVRALAAHARQHRAEGGATALPPPNLHLIPVDLEEADPADALERHPARRRHG
jgi:hypothetical protein